MCELVVLRIYLKTELCSLLLGSNFNFNSGVVCFFFFGVNSEWRLNALKSYVVRLNFDLTQSGKVSRFWGLLKCVFFSKSGGNLRFKVVYVVSCSESHF